MAQISPVTQLYSTFIQIKRLFKDWRGDDSSLADDFLGKSKSQKEWPIVLDEAYFVKRERDSRRNRFIKNNIEI